MKPTWPSSAAGFTGLAAAASLRRIAPEKTVAVLEAARIGAGASGRTGGLVLSGVAWGEDPPGLGDVLAGYTKILRELNIDADLTLPGAWEIARQASRTGKQSPISWQDAGTLRVVDEVPGGSVDPGKVLGGLGRAAASSGAMICENAGVRGAHFGKPLRFELPQGELCADQALFATNAMALDLTLLAGHTQAALTMAVATEPLNDERLAAIGLAERKPFYTSDFPYLWGRLTRDNRIIFGSGLVHAADSRELSEIDVTAGKAAERLDSLESRVHGLHPALREVKFTHRWGGPILFGESGRPVFARHPRSSHALIVAAYSGHGVALSVYLGCWAAEVLTGQRSLPAWGNIDD